MEIAALQRMTQEQASRYPKEARALASYQCPFGVNASRRREKVTQDKASGTTRPTFKTPPLDNKVQILPHLREQVLLERLLHWINEQVARQDTLIYIGASDHDTFWVEYIDKIGEGHTQKYSCSLKGRNRRFIAASRLFYDFQKRWFLDPGF